MSDEIPDTRAEYQAQLAKNTPNRWIPRPELRRWLYGILSGVAALLTGYGVITTDEGGLWLSLIGVLLGTGQAVAARNVPTD